MQLLNVLSVLFQELVVGSRARRPFKSLVSSPVAVLCSLFFVHVLHTAPSGANIGVCAVRNAKGA